MLVVFFWVFDWLFMPFFLLGGLYHPYHVSVCELRPDLGAQRIEIRQQVFLDDLESALQYHDSQSDFDITDTTRYETIDARIHHYYRQHLHIETNTKKLDWVYLGHEIKTPYALLYAEAPLNTLQITLRVRNTLLTERLNKQENIVHIQSASKKWHSFRLHKQKTWTEWVRL